MNTFPLIYSIAFYMELFQSEPLTLFQSLKVVKVILTFFTEECTEWNHL